MDMANSRTTCKITAACMEPTFTRNMITAIRFKKPVAISPINDGVILILLQLSSD